MSLTSAFAHELPDGAYEVKQFNRKEHDEIIEILAFRDVETNEVTYMGAVIIPIQTPKGIVSMPQPFKIEASCIEEAFEGIGKAAEDALEALRKRTGATIVKPRNVTPEMLEKLKKGPLAKKGIIDLPK